MPRAIRAPPEVTPAPPPASAPGGSPKAPTESIPRRATT
jgi:hypothetical protein